MVNPTASPSAEVATDALASAAARIRASALYDAALFAPYWKRSNAGGAGDVEAYLLSQSPTARLGEIYDGAFYTATYPDAGSNPAMALRHYVEVGLRQARCATETEVQRRLEMMAPHFDLEHYLLQAPVDAGRDPLRHYVLYGEAEGLEPAADFSPDYYRRRYFDIANNGLSPFYHYAEWGKEQGRTGRPRHSESLAPGARLFDPLKPTMVFVVHDVSLSGAPVLGLALCRKFSATHNIVVVRSEGGPLHEAFLEESVAMLASHLDQLDAEYFLRDVERRFGAAIVIGNSAMTSQFASAALNAGAPSVSLVHEHARYTWPPGRITTAVETSDRVVVATDVLRISALAEVAESRTYPAGNISVQAQGYVLPPPSERDAAGLGRAQIMQRLGVRMDTRTKIVLGAGTVEMRKGVDLFVRTADRFRAKYDGDFRFVWIGGGYRPRADANYSTWIADEVRRLDLAGHVFFFEPQADFETFLLLADVFFVSSRLDPLPNTAIDAMHAQRQIVCFDDATGVAAILHGDPTLGEAVAYCDVDAAAEALIRRLDPAPELRRVADPPELDFDAYHAHVARAVDEAIASRAEVEKHAERIDAAGIFDASFHDGLTYEPSRADRKRAARIYAARATKGLLCLNPRPGVHQGRLREAAGASPEGELERLAGATVPYTHRCIDLAALAPPNRLPRRIGLHVHLHYAELAAEFSERIESAGIRMDLVLTTTSDRKAKEIAYAFRDYRLGRVEIVTGPNRGRDVGPLFFGAARFLRAGGYDVVGHLHGKRSIEAESVFSNDAVGERWRRYLLGILLGDRTTLAKVLGLFEREPELGLVFPEDRHCVGWQGNREIAAALAQRLVPATRLPEVPIFPVGTMFWCRPETLVPLWDAGFTVASFPVEPLAYDGTLPHALEAMIPAVCESTGYTWATIFDRRCAW